MAKNAEQIHCAAGEKKDPSQRAFRMLSDVSEHVADVPVHVVGVVAIATATRPQYGAAFGQFTRVPTAYRFTSALSAVRSIGRLYDTRNIVAAVGFGFLIVAAKVP